MVESNENISCNDKFEDKISINNIAKTDNIVYVEADKYLDFVTQQESEESDKQDLIDKRNILVNWGFTNSQEVKEADIEISRIERLKTLNNEKAHMVTIIKYFASKYPEYKYIPQKYVDEICEKYGLKHCDASDYTGVIPDDTVEQIEKLNVELCDRCFSIINSKYNEILNWNEKDSLNHYFQELPLEIIIYPKRIEVNLMESDSCQSDQKREGIEVITVLKPVFFEEQKHYLIVTAWGLEGSDEMVVNQRNN